MNYRRALKGGMNFLKEKIFENKKLFYSLIVVVLFLLIYAVFVRGYIQTQEDEKRIAKEQVEKIKQETKKEDKIKNAKFSRITFFLTSPFRASLAVPDYLEGNYRLKEEGNKAMFLYIKNPDIPTPLFYIKYIEKNNYKEELGEKILKEFKSKKDGKNYILIYYFYPDDSYKGEDQEGFKEILWDIENVVIESLKIF